MATRATTTRRSDAEGDRSNRAEHHRPTMAKVVPREPSKHWTEPRSHRSRHVAPSSSCRSQHHVSSDGVGTRDQQVNGGSLQARRPAVSASRLAIRPLTRPDQPVDSNTSAPSGPALSIVNSRPDTRRSSMLVGGQQRLALEFASPTPFVPMIVTSEPKSVSIARSSQAWVSESHDDGFFERQPTGRAKLPEPARWARQYAQAWVEVTLGRRPIRQLSRWSSPDVLAAISRSHDVAPGMPRRHSESNGHPPRPSRAIVSGLRVDEPADGVAEIAAVIRTRDRSRALMLRLEGWDGRWVCTYAAMV